VSTRRTEVTITQYNINGELLSSSSIGVKPKGTIHIPLHDAFPEFGVGSIKVEASRDRSLCFHTMIYQYNDDYTEVIEAQAVTPLDGMVPRLSTSYNLYLGMANWLRLLNTSEQTIGISIAFGEHQAESPLTLKAHARVDIPIHELPLDRNSYGLLIIEADTGNALSGEIVRSTYNAGGKLNLLTTIPLR
jgi:hypothetical protein